MSGVESRAIGRRSFLVGVGRRFMGVAVLGLAGCGSDDGLGAADAPARSGSAAGLAWSRVDLAYVSAYVLVRGGEAAVVDTGFGSTVDRIGAVLDAAGAGWDGVRHVVITHSHYDHSGGLEMVADRAAGAVLHVGEADRGEIQSFPVFQPRTGRRLRAVVDGEEIFGLQVVATPGHTPGHIAVFDPDSALLVAGDALTNTIEGVLSGPLPEATEDPTAAADSVRKLAGLRPQVILVGHGPPLARDAAGKLRRLASSQG